MTSKAIHQYDLTNSPFMKMLSKCWNPDPTKSALSTDEYHNLRDIYKDLVDGLDDALNDVCRYCMLLETKDALSCDECKCIDKNRIILARAKGEIRS